MCRLFEHIEPGLEGKASASCHKLSLARIIFDIKNIFDDEATTQ